ncbi:hypothetical protein HN51_042651 [Arachis hypogaea]
MAVEISRKRIRDVKVSSGVECVRKWVALSYRHPITANATGDTWQNPMSGRCSTDSWSSTAATSFIAGMLESHAGEILWNSCGSHVLSFYWLLQLEAVDV